MVKKAAPTMAVPVTVLPIPNEPPQGPSHHLVYNLNENAQIGLEIRSTRKGDRRNFYANNGTSAGYIKNPGSFAGIIQDCLPTVYGIAKSGPADSQADVISRLSPYYNPIGDYNGGLFATEHKALSACSDDESQKYYVHFLQKIGTTNKFRLVELDVDIDQATATPNDNTHISADSNLTSLSYGNRWIFWVDGMYVKYVSTGQPEGIMHLENTIGVKADSPLAVTAFKSREGDNSPLLRIALYYMNGDQFLTRCTGVIQNERLTITETKVVNAATPMNQYSFLAVVPNKDDTNSVYYIPQGSATYEYDVFMDRP